MIFWQAPRIRIRGKIQAKTQDGVLTLCLPKSKRATVHKIKVE